MPRQSDGSACDASRSRLADNARIARTLLTIDKILMWMCASVIYFVYFLIFPSLSSTQSLSKLHACAHLVIGECESEQERTISNEDDVE